MSDIKHKKFDMNLGTRPSQEQLSHNWNLMNASQVPQDVPFINNTIESQEVREVKVAELCKWATLTALLTGETLSLPLSFFISLSIPLYLSFPPTISDRRCASPSLKAMPLSSWGNRNGAISFRLALAHLCLLLSSCFQASKSSKLKKKKMRKRERKKRQLR